MTEPQCSRDATARASTAGDDLYRAGCDALGEVGDVALRVRGFVERAGNCICDRMASARAAQRVTFDESRELRADRALALSLQRARAP